MDPNLAATSMVQIMNGYLLQGRFDHMVNVPADEMAELKARLAEMEAKLGITAAEPKPDPGDAPAAEPESVAPAAFMPEPETKFVGPSALIPDPEPAKVVALPASATVEEVGAQPSMKELRAIAKKAGFNSFGMKKDALLKLAAEQSAPEPAVA